MRATGCVMFSLFLLLLFAGIGFCLTDGDIRWNYTEASDSVQMVPFNVEQGNYTLFVINGKETFFLENKTGGKLLNVSEDITAVLDAYAMEKAEVADKRYRMEVALQRFNASRNPAEDTCQQYTGTEGNPCFDKEECIRRCFGVPICTQGYTVPGLMDEIVVWVNSTYELDENLNAVWEEMPGLETGNGAAVAGDIEGKIDSINAEVNTISGLRLFKTLRQGGWEFCPAIPFNLSALQEAKNLAEVVNGDLEAMADNGPRAQAIINNSRAQMNQSAYVRSMFAGYKQQLIDAKGKDGLEAYSFRQKLDISDLEAELANLSNRSDRTIALGEGRNYTQAIAQASALLADFRTFEGKLNASKADYEEVKGKFQQLQEKLAVAENITDPNNVSEQGQIETWKNETNGMAAEFNQQMSKGRLEGISGEIAGLKEEIEDYIVAKAASGGVNKPKETNWKETCCPGVALPFSIVLLALFLRKERKNK